MNYKKTSVTITLLSLFVAVVIFTLYPKGEKNTNNAPQKKTWTTYTDEINHFQVDYQSNLQTNKIKNTDRSFTNDSGMLEPSGGVNFTPSKDGPGIMGVHIYKGTGFESVQDWLDYKTKLSFITRQKHNPEEYKSIDNYLPPFEVEKSVNIVGQEATVTYPVSRIDGNIYETFEYEKQTVFLKDGIVYVIWTRYFDDERDYEHVWNSFKIIQ